MARRKRTKSNLITKLRSGFRFKNNLFVEVEIPSEDVTSAKIIVKENDRTTVLTAGESPTEEVALWENDDLSGSYLGGDVQLSESIANFEQIKLTYARSRDGRLISVIYPPEVFDTAQESFAMIGEQGYYRGFGEKPNNVMTISPALKLSEQGVMDPNKLIPVSITGIRKG